MPRTCAKCDQPARARCLCAAHYAEWKRLQIVASRPPELRGRLYAAEKRRALRGDPDAQCSICARPGGAEKPQKLHWDHDHKTGAHRGWLCQACNVGLGYYERWQRPVGLVIEPYDVYLNR